MFSLGDESFTVNNKNFQFFYFPKNKKVKVEKCVEISDVEKSITKTRTSKKFDVDRKYDSQFNLQKL